MAVFLAGLAVAWLSAGLYAQPADPGDLAKPPPIPPEAEGDVPIPPKIQDEQIEPTVTIREEENRMIEEYRRARPMFYGDYYPLTADTGAADIWVGVGNEADLAAALRAWGEVEPSLERRVALLREAGDLARDELASPELAAEHYQALLAVERDDLDALRELAEIRASQSRWNEVVGLLERQLDVAPADQRSDIARSMGATYDAILDLHEERACRRT